MKLPSKITSIPMLTLLCSAIFIGCSNDSDGDGVLNDIDCSPENASITFDKTQDGDCDGINDVDDCEPGVSSAIHKKDDLDCDGTLNDVDCAQNNPKIKTEKNQDTDCDGIINVEDCEPEKSSTQKNTNDSDCDGIPNSEDCNPNGSLEDLDCDGVLNDDDCDPKDAKKATSKKVDLECDGFVGKDDCNPKEVDTYSKIEDLDCDGIANDDDCDPKGHVGDRDCDNIKDDEDCDASDKDIATKKSEDADCDGRPEIQIEAFSYVSKFKNMNEIKQKQEREKFPGTLLKGTGKIFEVAECGWTDKSKKYGSGCYKITLDKGSPRVVLYFDSSKADELSEYSKGKNYTFGNCVGTDITDWGFWATATCDMPED